MKTNYFLIAGVAAALGTGGLSARTWTSSDGGKTFEGEFKSYNPAAGTISVVMNTGKFLTFDIAKISDADKAWVEAKQQEAAGPSVEETLEGQKIGAKLAKRGILQKIDGNRFANYTFEKAPEYYILYFSASW